MEITVNIPLNVVRNQQLQKLDAIKFLRFCEIENFNIERNSVYIKIIRCAKIVYSDKP